MGHGKSVTSSPFVCRPILRSFDLIPEGLTLYMELENIWGTGPAPSSDALGHDRPNVYSVGLQCKNNAKKNKTSDGKWS